MTDHIPKYLQKCPPSPTTQTICAYLPDPYSHCQQEGPLMSLPASNLFWVNFNWSVWYEKQQAFTPHFLGDGLLLELCTYWGSCTYLSAAMHLLGPGTSWCPCTVLSTTHISIIHSWGESYEVELYSHHFTGKGSPREASKLPKGAPIRGSRQGCESRCSKLPSLLSLPYGTSNYHLLVNNTNQTKRALSQSSSQTVLSLGLVSCLATSALLEPIINANFQAPPQTCWVRTLGWSQRVSGNLRFHKSPGGSEAWSSENILLKTRIDRLGN